eukprot:TRINITY_DN5730_c0_g1_i1.p1 TRINITY_DN5730_c0_g1~~TRINITY_DN5730_c0_g1_i1.p1  ORF type:complete len:504 (+),score=117.45 TRINITY_DN5730_c0_g1_i1:56-1513(+)
MPRAESPPLELQCTVGGVYVDGEDDLAPELRTSSRGLPARDASVASGCSTPEAEPRAAPHPGGGGLPTGLQGLLAVLVGVVCCLCMVPLLRRSAGARQDPDGDGAPTDWGEQADPDPGHVAWIVAAAGFAESFANVLAGGLADLFGRRLPLALGWQCGTVCVVLLMLPESALSTAAASVLLGMQQGLCWCASLVALLDLSGPRGRALAAAVAVAPVYAVAAGGWFVAVAVYDQSGLRATSGVALVLCSFALCAALLAARETRHRAEIDAEVCDGHPHKPGAGSSCAACCQRTRSVCAAALAMGVATGTVWGRSVVCAAEGTLAFSVESLYAAFAVPACFGAVGGAILSDVAFGGWRVPVLVTGATVHFVGAVAAALSGSDGGSERGLLVACALLAAGTGLAEPAMTAAVVDGSPPQVRATSVGTFRLCRLSGLAAGTLIPVVPLRASLVTALAPEVLALAAALAWLLAAPRQMPGPAAPAAHSDL